MKFGLQKKFLRAAIATGIFLTACGNDDRGDNHDDVSVVALPAGGALTDAPPPCTPLYVIGVRGATEQLDGPFRMGARVGGYVQKAAALLPADQTAYFSLPYEAKRPGLEYDQSVEDGATALTALVASRIIDCPGIRIGLVGYSAGAQVINMALNRLSQRQLNHIGSVLLLTDLFSAGSSTNYRVTMTPEGGPAPPPRGGILKRQALPPAVWARTIDFCIKGDPICDSEGIETIWDLILIAMLSGIHSDYHTCCGSVDALSLFGSAFAERLVQSRMVVAAPYLYLGRGNPPSAPAVMQATGIKQFTMAYILSGGGCNPAWDGNRPLTGGIDEQSINATRAAGGDVQVSFGGWDGNKLGPSCATAQALAGAYQRVIDAYRLRHIDIDIENTDEFENPTVQDRILNALKIIKQNNPGIRTSVTFPTSITGPTTHGIRLINRAAALQANVDNFTIMPFDFGCSGDMATCSNSAIEGLKSALKGAFGWSDFRASTHMGISGMNGLSDLRELTTPQTWTQIRDGALIRGVTRFAFWAVNRDRPCPGSGVRFDCSGIAQADWEFTRTIGGF